ncbi:MAG: hypothetical protein ABIX01_08085 [Chitinophagaceae bacterium]
MSNKRIQLIAGILLILAAAAELFSLQVEHNSQDHKTTMTIMASGMAILGILLVRKGIKEDDASKTS